MADHDLIIHTASNTPLIEPLSPDRNLLDLYLLRYDRPHTKRAYRNDLTGFFKTDFITLDLCQQVNFVHINAHLEAMEQAGQKPTSLQRRISAIRGFFDWLVALQLLDTNPAHRKLVRKIRSVRRSDRAITFLSQAQAKQLLDATDQNGASAVRDRTLILVLLHAVLRRAEAAAMNVEHLKALGPYWILELPHTKGGADQFVKMPPHVIEAIEAMKRHYGIEAGALWRSLSRNKSRGKRLSPSAIYEMVRRTAKRAGLTDNIGAHTLRHTGCTLAIDAGASVQQVQTHARHKHIETTMHYVHQRDKLRDSAADYIRL